MPKRLMIICCLNYGADALVRFYSLILGLPSKLPLAEGFEWLYACSSLLHHLAIKTITVLVPMSSMPPPSLFSTLISQRW